MKSCFHRSQNFNSLSYQLIWQYYLLQSSFSVRKFWHQVFHGIELQRLFNLVKSKTTWSLNSCLTKSLCNIKTCKVITYLPTTATDYIHSSMSPNSRKLYSCFFAIFSFFQASWHFYHHYLITFVSLCLGQNSI